MKLKDNSNKGSVSTEPFYNSEIIAALASAHGRGGVAVIRVSGNKALEACEDFLVGRKNPEARKAYLYKFIDPETSEVIDEPLILYFKGPNSFTGEDCLEIHCHGGPYIVQNILRILFSNGIRMAEPGEFTKRAFLNGKMDLTEAEGIKELIDANSKQEFIAARQLSSGKFAAAIEELRSEIIGAMAYLEARIDFPDEGDTRDVELQHVRERALGVLERLNKLDNSYDSGRVAAEGLMVSIVGAPNMGKSTLMNYLLRDDRAIVTDIAGTTRDYLEEKCLINGRLIRLVDTAGVRETEEVVEKIGVERSLELAKKSDLVLMLCASTASKEEVSYCKEWIAELGEEKCVFVETKADLAEASFGADFSISCTAQTGLDTLEKTLSEKVDGYIGKLDNEAFVSSARHHEAILKAKNFVESFFAADSEGQYEEMLAFELLSASKALYSIIGSVENDDVLERIFSEFCVGK